LFRFATDVRKELVEDSVEKLLRVWDEWFRERHGPISPPPRLTDLSSERDNGRQWSSSVLRAEG
jgi:hypothetical protein